MEFPKKEQLPISSDSLVVDIDHAKVALFQKSFGQDNSSQLPMTWGAIGLQGIFQILNNIQVDWKKLLHATQKFEYGEKPGIPFRAISSAQLIDIKFRAQIYWLSFEATMRDEKTNNVLVKSKTLILVRE